MSTTSKIVRVACALSLLASSLGLLLVSSLLPIRTALNLRLTLHLIQHDTLSLVKMLCNILEEDRDC